MQPNTDKGYKGMGMEGRIAAWYARNTARDMPDFAALAQRVTAALPARSRILEVAPGPGYLAVEIARRGAYQVTGLDISHTFVEIATRNAREAHVDIDFRQGNAAAMPFAENAFDLVLCRAAFKNFSQPVAAMNEMYRVLEPSGRAHRGLRGRLRGHSSEGRRALRLARPANVGTVAISLQRQ